MSSVSIDYDKLGDISSNASTAASKINGYINNLTRKVTNKYSGLSGGSSRWTQDSEYYVSQKITKLTEKSEKYSTFSTAVSTFVTNAKAADLEVSKSIKSGKDEFIDKHDYIDTNCLRRLVSLSTESLTA